jgi:hypothetical protein
MGQGYASTANRDIGFEGPFSRSLALRSRRALRLAAEDTRRMEQDTPANDRTVHTGRSALTVGLLCLPPTPLALRFRFWLLFLGDAQLIENHC